MRFLAMTVTLLLLAPTPCRAACQVDHYNFYHGSEVSTTMYVTSGAQCSIDFQISGKSSIDSIAITKQARHGAASWNGSAAYAKVRYKSSPGYKGQDEFSFDILGPSQRSSSPASVRVSVEVR
jgi:hypothetical protein